MQIYLVPAAEQVTVWILALVDLPADMEHGVAEIATSLHQFRTDPASLISFNPPGLPPDPFSPAPHSRHVRTRVVLPRGVPRLELKLVRRRTDWNGVVEWLEPPHRLYDGVRDLFQNGNVCIELSRFVHADAFDPVQIPRTVSDGGERVVEFRYPDALWHNVENYVLGDFNDWRADADSAAAVPFESFRSRTARHFSQYLLHSKCPAWPGGRYTTNPQAPMVNNGFGGFNNILVFDTKESAPDATMTRQRASSPR